MIGRATWLGNMAVEDKIYEGCLYLNTTIFVVFLGFCGRIILTQALSVCAVLQVTTERSVHLINVRCGEKA